MAKINKRTKKFANSGGLKNAIAARRKHQKNTRGIRANKDRKAVKAKAKALNPKPATAGDGGSDEELPEGNKFQGMSVDDFLKGDFMEEDGSDAGGSGSEGGEDDDTASFASVDDFDDEEQHMLELSALAKKDPDFFKYLQENDQELLNFSVPEPMDEDDESTAEGEEGSSDEDTRMLSEAMLKGWQSDILKFHSLKALRMLLNAFRSSANLSDESKGEKREYTTESPELFNKLVVTSLKYTPMVLRHHIPYKELSDGRFKPPVQNKKTETISQMVASFLTSIVRLIDQLADTNTHVLALTESSKLIPYISHRRRPMKLYLKMCLELWSTGDDEVRLAAYMALRKVGLSYDVAMLDMVLKSSYLTLVRAASKSNEHTLPASNLMKNTASELYCINPTASYQHGFTYIRQLAIHLRNSMKVKSKDALKQVYNWQFVHCVDFWCMVLAKACDAETSMLQKRENSLKPLIYPLVQVTVGALQLGSGMRYHPLHFHLIRSLLHLIRHTKTYIPLAPFILPIITTPLSSTSKFKASKLKPLDLSTQIHVPKGYLRTRILVESILEEATFLLGEWCESVQGSIAFPELMIPIVATLKRSMKKSKGGKSVMTLKVLLERINDGCKWVESRRSRVRFGPGDGSKVVEWEASVDVSETPVGKWVKIQRKARITREEMKRKSVTGEAEMLDDDDDGDVEVDGEEGSEDDNDEEMDEEEEDD